MATPFDPNDPTLPHDNLQNQAIGMIFAFPAVATVAVLLRVYIRVYMRSFAADDWVICVASVLYWAETVTSYYVIKYNYIGYHIWDVPKDYPAELGAKFSYATLLLYNPILALIKTSILLFLLRLSGQKRSVRRAIWFLLGLNTVAALATFLITTFNCLPVSANWDPLRYAEKKCINFADFVTGTASVSIFTDVLVLLMPTWIVYNLQIGRKQKVMLVAVLSFGFVTVLAGLIRVILLDAFDRTIPPDSTYSVLFCLSTIEVGLAFVAACAPALKPLIVRLVPKLFGNTRNAKYENGHYVAERYGYDMDLDPMTRSRRTGATGTGDEESRGRSRGSRFGRPKERKEGIMMTTEMEVKYDQEESDDRRGGRGGEDGSSMESLVQAGGRVGRGR